MGVPSLNDLAVDGTLNTNKHKLGHSLVQGTKYSEKKPAENTDEWHSHLISTIKSMQTTSGEKMNVHVDHLPLVVCNSFINREGVIYPIG